MPYLDNRNSVLESLKEEPERSVRLWVEAGYERVSAAIMEAARKAGVSVRVLPREQFQRKMKDTKSHFLLEREDFRYGDPDNLLMTIPKAKTVPLLSAFDGIFDPQNLGNVIRTAACFNFDAVFLPKDNACGVTDTVVNVARGGTDHVSVSRVTNLPRHIEELKKRNVFCFGFDEGAEKNLFDMDLTMPLCLVLGGEEGLRRLTKERCDLLLRIPTVSSFSSLNVANAFAIAAYEVTRQRHGRTR
jgi:23S rRNA (guanosine2251-2'-O)-methyltransferase